MKDFNEIYQKIYNECHSEIEEKRKANLDKIQLILLISIITITLIALTISAKLIIPLIIIAVIICTIFTKYSSYNKTYKNIIISRLVSYYDENLKFTTDTHIQKSEYNLAEFEHYDHFYSNDYVYGKIDNLIDFHFGDVRTTQETTDSDGRKTETKIFQGIFSSAKLNKTIPNTIKIRSDKGLLGKLAPNKTLMSMDSQEFEKHFDVYANDKILAMRILTSDIMDYMIKFKQENKVKYEITIKNTSLFIRIHCTDIFESSIFKNPLDYKTLEEYYKYINFMCELNKKIYNTINEKEF